MTLSPEHQAIVDSLQPWQLEIINPLSNEQKLIVYELFLASCTLVKVSSVAGSGKTTLLRAIANLFPGEKLYTSFQKAVVTEAKEKMPTSVTCKTAHGLSYAFIVAQGMSMPTKPGQTPIKPGKRELVPFFGWRDINEKIPYALKVEVVEAMKLFFQSAETSANRFYTNYDQRVATLAKLYIKKMVNKEIPCNHDFYIKYMHILLARGVIKYPRPYAMLLLDEAQDVSPVLLEIVKLIPALKKVIVGDPFQSIYQFTGCINAFQELHTIGTEMYMTQSFRVSHLISPKIQEFCHKHLDPHMTFRGFEYPSIPTEFKSIGYLSRTNGALVARLIELNKANTPYNLTRPVKEIFRLPLLLTQLSPGKVIKDPEYRHLTDDMNDYYNNASAQRAFKNLFGYLSDKYEDDVTLLAGIRLISKFGGNAIWDAHNTAKTFEKDIHNYPTTVSSMHTSKGKQEII